MTVELGHLDDADRACERHPIDLAALLHLAAIGARTSSFNHDIASKIQGMMMALDEINELAATPDLKLAAETAQAALGELNQLLQANRVFTKAPVASRTALQDLLSRAAMRVGVTLRGARATQDVEVAVPLVTQALAMVFDAAAGTERRRAIELAIRVDGSGIELEVPISAGAVLPGESLAIAAWIMKRENGALCCSDKAIVIRLPAHQ